MKIFLIAFFVLVIVFLLLFVTERRKKRIASNPAGADSLERFDSDSNVLENSLISARNQFAGLHRWLSVLLYYPPFVVIDDEPEGLIDRMQTDLGRRFNEELIAAEQFPLNVSLQKQIHFFIYCFDELTMKYSKEIAQAVKNRDAAPQYQGHRGMSKVFDEQFNND